ncbi:MAG: anthranilate synthase component I [Bacillota bacterium]|nr:anthranilate synthase component I [Bacillota bacterium]
MISLNEEQFNQYKMRGEVFPIALTTNEDELTPIGVFYNLKGKNKFLLESASQESGMGRYSFIGDTPYLTIQSYKEDVEIISSAGIEKYKGKVLDYIKKQLAYKYNPAGIDIPFAGGAIGYVGYDVIRQYEVLPDNNEDKINIPEANLMFYKTYICYDHYKHKLSVIYNVLPEDTTSYNEIIEKLNGISNLIRQNNGVHQLKEADENKIVESNLTEEEYCNIVNKAKEYIVKGDIFQVVLSQRLKFKTKSEPFDVYRRLRSKNPSPYLFYIDFESYQVAGSSPESLVTVLKEKDKDSFRVITNPIAGTRPRGKTEEEDLKYKAELIKDEKEIAEHVMLVDLGRNDIGRISDFGTVNIDRFMEVDNYSHVMHLVSKVSGRLRSDYTCFEALSSCLPVGTVSGAPKVRAMEIIDELENLRRGLYAGAVGYFSYNGNMDTCIAIRTIVFKDETAYVQAGAGIVYDSNPASEYRETLNKAMAMKEVI